MTDALILAILADDIEHGDHGTIALRDVALRGYVRDPIADRIPEAAQRYEDLGGRWARAQLLL